MSAQLPKHSAIKFVILLGMVSLFADITYEGARSITGQYLEGLGATGAIVGITAGFGEFIGYGFRLISGYIGDTTKKYWLLVFIGYFLNLIAIPLLALAENWQMAALLILLERLGKAIRNPSRDAMLSYATKETGRGWGFGLHEAMDQIGAILGPLIIGIALYCQGGGSQESYRISFGMLLIPAACALVILAAARFLYPRPQDLEIGAQSVKAEGFSKKYWLYVAAVSCIGAGYVDFSLIAYHFQKMGMMPSVWIPLFFSIAMAFDGLSALLFGRLYDSRGISVLILATGISSLFVPLVFLGSFYFALLGMILWGVGLGAQESIMRAVVADLVQMNKRGVAYGALNVWFGISWFLGSAFMGLLYDISILSLLIFSVGIQLASLPIFMVIKKLK